MPVLRNISQLATCPPGHSQDDAGLISQAAVAWREKTISWVGPYSELPAEFKGEPVVDCERRLVVPGLVDCHTHLCFGGWRGDEFEARLQGASYQDIAAAGGGITRTVTATRGASLGELRRKAQAALESISGTDYRPESIQSRSEIVAFVRATLDHLPTNYATALEMKYINGDSVAEIAKALGVGEKAAESILSRARAAFKEGFKSLWDFEPGAIFE